MRIGLPFVLATVIATAAVLTGCAGTPRIERQTAETDFDYPQPERESDTGVRFVMLEPRLRSASEALSGSDEESLPPFAELTLQFQQQALIQLNDVDPASNPFQRRYMETYQPRLESALQRDIREVLQARGFQAGSTYASYREIGGEQRRDALLVTVPTATLALSREVESSECTQNYCTESGQLRLDGQFLFLMVEPESGASVIVRRMNLHTQGIVEPYVRQWRQDKEAGDAAPDSQGRLLDTSDKALVSVLNRFYDSVMAEIDNIVSRRHILAFNENMKELAREAPPSSREVPSSGDASGL